MKEGLALTLIAITVTLAVIGLAAPVIVVGAITAVLVSRWALI